MAFQLYCLSYFTISFIWSALTFVTLLPDVKSLVYTKCVWTFNFQVCDKVIGIEGGYRFTLSITLFYIFLMFLTVNVNPVYSIWFHQDCWILKAGLLILCNFIGFTIPFTHYIMKSLYYILLTGACCFIVAMFILCIDVAHALRLFWLRKAKASMDTPTCYMCTWLFALHLLTSLLYALSVDLILSFVFFNNTEDCTNILMFAGINILLCFLAFAVSYAPSLRERQCASQILFSTVLASVTYTTWLAMSDPENEFCNMYGTIFTGSLLDSSESFKSMVSLTIALVPLLFLCLKGDMLSYTRSLIANTESDEASFHKYSIFHVTMAICSCFVLMSTTNYYEPVFTVFHPILNSVNPVATTVIYFEGYDRYRFLSLCVVSIFLPIFYASMLCIRIIRDIIIKRSIKRNNEKQNESFTKKNESKESDCVFNENNDFLFIPITRSKALHMLKHRHSHVPFNIADSKLEFLLIQCFAILDFSLSFWHFPRYVSQTYYKGRNGSNACTIIAMIFGRYFSRSDIPYQNTGYLSDTWIKLYNEAIEEGSILYDSLVKDLGVLDLSIEEVTERFGCKLNVSHILPSLAVSFESDVETATILYQLRRLASFRRKQVVLLIHKTRTSAFLIYENEEILFADSHAFGENGSVLITCQAGNIEQLVQFLRDLLGNNENRLSTLTEIQYEQRWNYSKLY